MVDTINSGGGVLPSSTGDSRLVELEEPYVTNLKPLNDLSELAKRNGCHGMKRVSPATLSRVSIAVEGLRSRAPYSPGSEVSTRTTISGAPSGAVTKARTALTSVITP